VFSGDSDGNIRIWDLKTGKNVYTINAYSKFAYSPCLSANCRWLLSKGSDHTIHLWELDWELEVRDKAEWSEGAHPYLKNFLTQHTPYAGELPRNRDASEREIQLALTRRGKPIWNEEDFQELLFTLGYAGYGWLRPEGVRKKLEEMAANWQGPPLSYNEDSNTWVTERMYDAKMEIVRILQSVERKGGKDAPLLGELAKLIKDEAVVSKSMKVPISHYKDANTGKLDWTKRTNIASIPELLLVMRETKAWIEITRQIAILNNPETLITGEYKKYPWEF
jgi:hypothetical protein